MQLPSFALWWDAVRFHLRHAPTLLPAAPLLCLPVFTDVLHSCLVRQAVDDDMRLGAAAREAARAVPPTLWLKLGSELRGLLWSLIPIVFIVRVIEHRLCWGLASNVVVFEGLRGEEAYARCRQLARDGYQLGLRALVAVPFLLAMLVLMAANFAGEWTHSRWVFAAAAFAWLWIFLPGSAAANTFYYARLIEQEQAAAPAPPLAAANSGAPLF